MNVSLLHFCELWYHSDAEDEPWQTLPSMGAEEPQLSAGVHAQTLQLNRQCSQAQCGCCLHRDVSRAHPVTAKLLRVL